MSPLSDLLAEQERVRRELLDHSSIAKRQTDGAENAAARHECDRQRFGKRGAPDPVPPHKTTEREKRRYRRERRDAE